MIILRRVLTASAAVALAMGTAAIAQSYGGDPAQGSAAGAAMSAPQADPATGAGANVNATVVTPDNAPPGQVMALQSGNNTTVTNGPVPDTAANRAKYGKPMSHAGRRTAPAGN